MQTWYLKYRPQTLEQLDLVRVKTTLQSMLAGQSWPHAWLFVGPRGLGKTSSARILAKAINCQNRVKGEPCNECKSCRAITEGSCSDVLEIDAASNRGIDEIREIREKIRLAPMSCKYKVYIVDEVHMLTTEAANAILKTLEEPPEHAVFILCTTEPGKLLPTVVSRCMQVTFAYPTGEEMQSMLETVAKAEKIDYTVEALDLVARAAGGSFRDGIKLLEQVYLTKQAVKPESVQQVLGLDRGEEVQQFVAGFKQGNKQESIELIEALVQRGVSMKNFVEKVLEQVRVELVDGFKHGTLKPDQQEELVKLIDKLQWVYSRMRESSLPQLPLEVAVIEWQGGNAMTKPSPKGTSLIEAAQSSNPKMEEKKEAKKEEVLEPGELQMKDLVAKWAEILREVKKENHSVEALLRSTKPVEFNGKKMVLEVFYKFHKDKLESDKCKLMIEQAVCKVLGLGKMSLSLKLGDKVERKQEIGGVVEDEIIKAAEDVFGVKAM